MKKIIFLIIVFVTLLVTYGCAMNSNPNGDENEQEHPNFEIPEVNASFTQYKKFSYNGILYTINQVMTINPINEDTGVIETNMLFKYTEYLKNDVDNISNWSINYKQDTTDIIVGNLISKELVLAFYQEINTNLKLLIESINYPFLPHQNIYEIENVLSVNLEEEFTEVLVVELYLPYQLLNEQTNQTYIINVPIGSILGYKNENILKLTIDEEVIILSYDSFINSYNVFK